MSEDIRFLLSDRESKPTGRRFGRTMLDNSTDERMESYKLNIFEHSVDARLIVGMTRSGTTWMCQALNEHPQVAAFGETMFWGKRFVKPNPDGKYDAKLLSQVEQQYQGVRLTTTIGRSGPGWMKHISEQDLPALLHNAIIGVSSPVTPGEVYCRISSAIAEAEGKPVAIEKTPHHLNWLPRIFRELPNARVLVMVRNPYTFMLSYKHQGDRKNEHARRFFRHRYHPIGAALVWRSSMRAARRAVDNRPKQTMLIHLEELEHSDKTVFDRIQDFFQLEQVSIPYTSERVNSSFPNGKRPQLGADDVHWMNFICRREMARAGYSRQNAHFEAWSMLVSIGRIPLWGWRILTEMGAKVAGPVHQYLLRWL